MDRFGRVVILALVPALTLCSLALPARADVDPALAHGKLAVLEFRNKLAAKDRDALDPNYFADVVRSAALKALPGLGVITRENLIVLLAATGKKAEDCEGECEVDTGRRIGADLVISGDLVKIGTNFKLNLRLHETRTGSLINGAVASGKTVDELDERTLAAVQELLLMLRDAAQAKQASELSEDVRLALDNTAPVVLPAEAAPVAPAQSPAANDEGKAVVAAPPEAVSVEAGGGRKRTSGWRKVGYAVMGGGVLLGAGSLYFALKGKSLTNSIINGELNSGAEISKTSIDAKGTNTPAIVFAGAAGLTLVGGAILAIFSPSQSASVAALTPSLDGLLLAGRF